MTDHVDTGERFLEEGNLDAAAAAFSQALEHDAKDAAARIGLARVHAAQGDIEKATADYRAGLKLQPHGDAAAELAELLMGAGQDGDVEALVEQALELDPDHPRAYLLKAELATREGDFDTADDMLRKGVRRGGEVTSAHVFGFYQQWVAHLVSMGEAGKGSEVANRSADFFPDHVHLQILAAGAAETAQEPATALARYKDALEQLEPGNLRTEILEKIAHLAGAT